MSAVVVTGQQIGLLGGPLYATYKVLGAVCYAEEIGGRAVYWLETNDADFNEINHIDYIGADGHLKKLTWDILSGGLSCGLIPVDEPLVVLLNTFFDTIRQTPHTGDLRALVLNCYRPGRTLGEASRLLAAQLFGRLGVTLFDPSAKEFREFSRPMLMREAERTPPGAQCNLFCMMGDKRKAVFRDDKGFRLRDGSAVDLEDCELVPNVRTRNVVQDAYFGTDTYIAGPSEVEYIAELDPVYSCHGVQKAEVKKRMSAMLVEPRVKRLLDKTGLTLQQVRETERDILLRQVLAMQSGVDIKALGEREEELTADYLGELEALGLDRGAIGNALTKAIKADIGKRRAEGKNKNKDKLDQAGELSDRLRPHGQEQERVFNVFYYMNLYGGLSFIDWLYEQYDFEKEIIEIHNG